MFAPTGNDHEGCVRRRNLGRSDPLNLIYADARAAPRVQRVAGISAVDRVDVGRLTGARTVMTPQN